MKIQKKSSTLDGAHQKGLRREAQEWVDAGVGVARAGRSTGGVGGQLHPHILVPLQVEVRVVALRLRHLPDAPEHLQRRLEVPRLQRRNPPSPLRIWFVSSGPARLPRLLVPEANVGMHAAGHCMVGPGTSASGGVLQR